MPDDPEFYLAIAAFVAVTLAGIGVLLVPTIRRALSVKLVLLTLLVLPIVEILLFVVFSILFTTESGQFNPSELKCSNFHGGQFGCTMGELMLEGLIIIGILNFVTVGLISLPVVTTTLAALAWIKVLWSDESR